MNRFQLYLFVGVTVFGIALVELIQPGTVSSPESETTLQILGGVVTLYGLVRFYRRPHGRSIVETPEVERSEPTKVPGGSLTEVLRGFPGSGGPWGRGRAAVRQGLRNAAEAVLTTYRGIDRESAREQVAGGTWTDNPYAAGFLSQEGGLPRSLTDRIAMVRSGGRFRRKLVRETVETLASIAGVQATGRGPTPEDDSTGVESVTLDRTQPDGEMAVRRRRTTGHLPRVGAVALVALGIGVVTLEPGLLLAAVVGVGYASYARFSTANTPSLTATRRVSEAEPEPGEEVEVELTVTNEGGGACPDLRIIDGVPERLAVTEGSPRLGTALRVGESVTLTYTVTVRRGEHGFEPTLALVRNASGTVEQELVLQAETTVRTVLASSPLAVELPLRDQATKYAGRAETDSGGEGLEFHAVREYRPGDPMNRIDWNRTARTGELTTTEFRKERGVRAVVVIDARPQAYVGQSPTSEHAVDRSVTAAYRLFARLLEDGHQAGIAAFGRGDCWLAPGSATTHRQRGRDLLTDSDALQSRQRANRSGTYRWSRRLRRRLPDNTQLFVLSPLIDPAVLRTIRSFEARGFRTTVISPDPTATGTADQQLVAIQRAIAMTSLRGGGIPVIDWQPDDSLDVAIKKAAGVRR